jgi:hypothetical protein
MNFLPGWFPAGAAGAQPQLRLTHVSTTIGVSSGTFTFPSGIEPGDFLVYIAGAYDTGGDPPTMAVASGFTQFFSQSGNPGGGIGIRVVAGYKVADGSEDGQGVNISTSANTESETAVLLQFRPDGGIVTTTVPDSDFEITTNNPAAQALGAGLSFSLHFALYYATGAIATRSYSPAADAETTLDVQGLGVAYVKWKLFNPPSSAAEVTVDMPDSGDNYLLSALLLVKPF